MFVISVDSEVKTALHELGADFITEARRFATEAGETDFQIVLKQADDGAKEPVSVIIISSAIAAIAVITAMNQVIQQHPIASNKPVVIKEQKVKHELDEKGKVISVSTENTEIAVLVNNEYEIKIGLGIKGFEFSFANKNTLSEIQNK